MTIPDDIWKLGEARQVARLERNYSLADEIRDDLLSKGWEIIDAGGEFELRPKLRYLVLENVSSMHSVFEGREIAVAMIVSGFTEDAIDCINSISAYSTTPIFILCLGEVGSLEEVVNEETLLVKVIDPCGWGQAANAILQNVKSNYLVIMDPSTRLNGDALTLVLDRFSAGEYSAIGWRGGLINIEDDWRSVDDKGSGEVDVLFSYFLALNRESALEVGGFNARAIYYRNADIEFSLRLRQTGGRLLQMDLPLTQGRHHGYHDVDAEFREVQSKKNYDRILERFRGKNAILSPRR
jgi:hypothetical protein